MATTKVQIAKAFEPLFKPKRYKVFFGGRGAAKSWAFAQALLLKASSQPIRVLCTRELQDSIQESVHKLLSDTIDRLGLTGFFEIQQHTIRGINGSQFIFEGLKNNVTKIKSMEGVDIVWCEEAEAISELSWDLLIPTIRKENSEIWVSFNPADEMDATYQQYVTPYIDAINIDGKFEDEDTYVAKVSWRDNPWFPEELRLEKDKLKASSPRKYEHIWEGMPNADYEDSIIQPEWVNAAIDAHKKLDFSPCGVRVLGFDPADGGADAKATARRHGVVVEGLKQWLGGELPEAIDIAFDEAYEYRCTDIVYDSVGIGAGIKVELKYRKGNSNLNVNGFGGGDGVLDPDEIYNDDRTNKDVFRNRRAQFWWYLRDRFEATALAVEKNKYTDPDKLISLSSDIPRAILMGLKSELCRVRRKRSGNTRILLESKQEMKARGMKSPNMADALVMAFANPVHVMTTRRKKKAANYRTV